MSSLSLNRFAPSRRQVLRAVLIGVVPLLVAAGGAWAYLASGRYVSTENAYVKADMASVAADVSGKVIQVGVRQHQAVRPGQLLFRLDAAPFHFALRMADAHLSDVSRQIEALRASYQTGQAELKAADDTSAYLKREYERRRELARRSLTTQEQLDSAEHAWRAAQLQADAKGEDLRRVLAQLGGSPALPVESYPAYLAAKAERDQAEWNLGRTTVAAPIAGRVAQEPPVVGDYVRAGVPVFALVGEEPWIEANLKETELTYVAVGQSARVTVDAFPGLVWRASVISISPATGAEFSLLPPQNASGNWVKVVQRLPVRLRILPNPAAPPLHSGLSVAVEIDTGHQRELPGVLQKALAWPRAKP